MWNGFREMADVTGDDGHALCTTRHTDAHRELTGGIVAYRQVRFRSRVLVEDSDIDARIGIQGDPDHGLGSDGARQVVVSGERQLVVRRSSLDPERVIMVVRCIVVIDSQDQGLASCQAPIEIDVTRSYAARLSCHRLPVS